MERLIDLIFLIRLKTVLIDPYFYIIFPFYLIILNISLLIIIILTFIRIIYLLLLIVFGYLKNKYFKKTFYILIKLWSPKNTGIYRKYFWLYFIYKPTVLSNIYLYKIININKKLKTLIILNFILNWKNRL